MKDYVKMVKIKEQYSFKTQNYKTNEREKEEGGRKKKATCYRIHLDISPVEETEGRRKERDWNNFCPGARE